MRALFLGITLSLFGALGADAAVLCKTRGDALVARETCRKKDIPFAVEPGPQGPAGSPGAKGATGRWPVRVVDAAGNDVGPAVYLEWYLVLSGPSLVGLPIAYAVAQHPALGGAVLLGIDVQGNPTGAVYYASSDCTGPAVIRADGFMPVVEVIGDTVFVPSGPGAPAAASSEGLNFNGGCSGVTPRGGCCRPFTGPLSGAVAEATTTTLGELGLTRPFHAVGP